MYILTDDSGRVIATHKTGADGWIDAGDVPAIGEGESLYYVDGKFEVRRMVDGRAEQEALRAEAYRVEVDPLTCQIQRLRDEPQPLSDEVADEIAELMIERSKRVGAIKDRFPYPDTVV